ncbi:MAG: hypothetical protein KAY62_00105 [Burkholderiaceae bacterium]|nr:hypothetical protein [Burkholderiaceae bacterium]
MTLSEIYLLASAAFAGCVAAYPVISINKRWPRGAVYANGIAGLVYLVVMFLGLGFSVWLAYYEKSSWLILLWMVIASFMGPTFIPALFGRYTGALAILGAVGFLLLGIYSYLVA